MGCSAAPWCTGTQGSGDGDGAYLPEHTQQGYSSHVPSYARVAQENPQVSQQDSARRPGKLHLSLGTPGACGFYSHPFPTGY